MDSILDLIKLYFYFNNVNLKNNNIRKCVVELRKNVSGNYKGYVFSDSLQDAKEIKEILKNELQNEKINLNKIGEFKYYSMSKEGMFYNTLLKEKNCRFYKAENKAIGLNITLDLTDLDKKVEIRSNCLAIPSNSGGGVFQDNKLVAIISKTVFNKNKFVYSVIEPIISYELKSHQEQ